METEKSSKFRHLPVEKKFVYLKRSDIPENIYIDMIYESTFSYTCLLHQTIVRNPIFKKLAEKVKKTLSVSTKFGEFPVMYSIGKIFIRKDTIDSLLKGEESFTQILHASEMRYFAKFAKMLRRIDVQPLLDLSRDLTNLQDEPYFKIVLDEDLNVLFFSNETLHINRLDTAVIYAKQYPLEINFYGRELEIRSKNQKLFCRAVKKILPNTINDIQLQLALA